MQDEAPGMVFWHPKGWALWQQIEQYMRARLNATGYQEVRTPTVMDLSLVGKIRPLGKLQRKHVHHGESEKRDFAVKPMNCPGHVQIFNQGMKSYRDLPSAFGRIRFLPPKSSLPVRLHG
jgi:threonyl-tRNA synthetase